MVHHAGEEVTHLQDIILELLDSSTVDLRQDCFDLRCRLCESLLRALQRVKKSSHNNSRETTLGAGGSNRNFIRTSIEGYNNKSASNSIRVVLGNMPSATISKLAPLLAELMSTRVDSSELLPATQDDRANEEAMGRNAITLTRQGLLAAELYVELIGMPGAWGTGLIEVGSLCELSALLHRWSVECSDGGLDRDTDIEEAQKRKSSRAKSDPPPKRSRKKNPRRIPSAHVEESSDDEASYTSENGGLENINEEIDASSIGRYDTIMSPNDVLVGGLKVAHSLAMVPIQKDFTSWSSESREAIVDAAIVALLTSTAVMSKNSRSKTLANKKHIETTTTIMGKSAASALSESLMKCLVLNMRGADDAVERKDYGVTGGHHETSVFIMRGLFPSLTMQMDLPNGQSGRSAAHVIAVSTLLGLIQNVTNEYDYSNNCKATRTPAKSKTYTPEPSGEMRDAKTPMSSRRGRRKRVSFGGIEGSTPEEQAPPTLRKSNTPGRSRSYLSYTGAALEESDRPRPILSAILGLLQKLVTFKGLDRASVRSLLIDVVQKCLPPLAKLERSHFLRFLIQLCHSRVSVHRLVCVELVATILTGQWLWRDHTSDTVPFVYHCSASKTTSLAHQTTVSPQTRSCPDSIPVNLLRVLQGRLLDRMPAVRARTAYSFVEMIQRVAIEDVAAQSGDSSCSSFSRSLHEILDDLLHALRKRVLDERATVRKAAVNALSTVQLLGEESRWRISEHDILLLSQLCTDNSVATRKAAADALTNLLLGLQSGTSQADDRCRNVTVMVEKAWSASVLPQALDVEASCCSKAVDLFCQVIVEPIVQRYRSETDAIDICLQNRYEASWRMLAHVDENSRQEGAARGEAGALKVALRKLAETYETNICQQLLSEARVVAVRTLENDGEDNIVLGQGVEAQRVGVWCLLDAITDQEKEIPGLSMLIKKRLVSLEFLASCWESMFRFCQQSPTSVALQSSMRSCLKILSKLARHIPIEDAHRLSHTLMQVLNNFELASDLVGYAVAALVSITHKISGETDHEVTKQECSVWIKQIYKSCEQTIAAFVSAPQATFTRGDTKLVRALFVAGEISMVGFRADEDSISQDGQLQTRNPVDAEDPVAGFYQRPSPHLLCLVQAMLPKELPTGEKSNGEMFRTPQSARAHAFVALGKLCLRDENLAKNCITILARELHQNMTDTCAPVQSNALLVLGDLCVKYTHLVDRYLPVMAACLQSGSSTSDSCALFDTTGESTALVRKHAVLLLSSLLLQDYIKWRGLLFHRFLVASVDDDEGVSKLAEMTMCGPLLSKSPKLFFSNFVESLFVLNRCKAHPVYAAAAASGDNGAGITVGFDGINLSGKAGQAKRQRAYKLMLSRMTDEEKIGVTARLTKDVLGAALGTDGDLGVVCRKPLVSIAATDQKTGEGRYSRYENAFHVLSDAFTVLSSSELRVGRASTATETDDIENDTALDGKAQDVAVAKGKLLSKICRKHLIEIVLPILCNLKTILQSGCSPLLKELMRNMVEIFRVYKSEVNECLANDPTLLQEIEYDARQFKKAQKMDTSIREVVRLA